MLVVGLTGSIGMGKSTAAARFRAHGIKVFDADAEVHRLYAGPLAPDIERAFPGSVKDGKVDRTKALRAIGRRPARLQTSRSDCASEDSGRRTLLPSGRARTRRSRGSARSAVAVRGRRRSHGRRQNRGQRHTRGPAPTRASATRNDGRQVRDGRGAASSRAAKARARRFRCGDERHRRKLQQPNRCNSY